MPRTSLLTALLALGLLAGCSTRLPDIIESGDSGPDAPVDVSHVPDAIPRAEPRSRHGNPKSYVVNGKRYYTLASARGYVERGIASWYGRKFHGRRTSSGERYDMYAMTAAHKSLPLPTYVRVTNLNNGRSVVVRVNDRGPFHQNRIIDLSYAAASKLGILGRGTGLVEVRAVGPGSEPLRVARRQPAPAAAEPIPQVDRSPLGHQPRLFIQVGAFANIDNAQRLKARLERSLQREVRIRLVENGTTRLYRVQVGPLASVDKADALTLQLNNLGVGRSQVLID